MLESVRLWRKNEEIYYKMKANEDDYKMKVTEDEYESCK